MLDIYSTERPFFSRQSRRPVSLEKYWRAPALFVLIQHKVFELKACALHGHVRDNQDAKLDQVTGVSVVCRGWSKYERTEAGGNAWIKTKRYGAKIIFFVAVIGPGVVAGECANRERGKRVEIDVKEGRANRKLRFSRVRQSLRPRNRACKVKSRLSHIIMMLPRRGNIMLVRYFRRPSRIEQLRSSTGGHLLEGFANELSQGRYQWVAARKHIRAAEHFLHWIAHRNQRHEVPPPAFGREERPRRTPYIYSREDVQRLVQAASQVGRYPNPAFRGLTYSTFFGLLACTGMRLSEAINLRLQDITPDGPVIRNTKFRKNRLIPLHPTAQAALERYLPKRHLFAPFDDHVFVGLRKHKLFRHDAYVAFRKSIEKIGLPRHSGLPRPTIHALRHTFAVRALETCPDDRDRITQHMVALSTYLGHSDIKHTYWYLEATPELMGNIVESTQRYFMGGRP